MPDITICMNKLCPLNKRCYRFLVKPSKNQSYTNFHPFVTKDGKDKCDNFLQIQVSDILKQL